jgi:hypothetical protein
MDGVGCMARLRELVGSIFPEESLLPGLRLVGKGRVFSIRLQGQDDAVGVDLDAFRDWPKERKRCDGLFLCLPGGARQFIVVLVELKGGHVEKALNQLQATSSVLCKHREDTFRLHADEGLLQIYHGLASAGHGRRVLGYIVARQGLNLKQDERSRLRRDFGITVKIRRSVEGLTCTELASGFTP